MLKNASEVWVRGSYSFIINLTKKGEVTKKSSQQVHDKHGQDGDVGDILHPFLGGAEIKASKENTIKTLSTVLSALL